MVRQSDVYSRGGIITEKNSDYCTVRLRLPAGVISPAQMVGVARIAEKYGRGDVHLTTRQTMEIPHVEPKNLEAMVVELKENGTPLGAEREEVVNVVACPGNDRCRASNIDSISLAKKIDEKHFGKDMPVKIRVSISACPNSCSGEQFNEICITGICKPIRDPGLCTGCGTCVQYCRESAVGVKNGTVQVDDGNCIVCGACVSTCPYDILTSESPAYRISVGGRRGRHPAVGKHFITVTSEDLALEVVDRLIDQVYRYAYTGKLLADQLDKMDFDVLKESLMQQLPEGSILNECI